MSELKKSAISGTKWTTISTIYTAILQLILLIVLARYLDKSDFGLMAIAQVVIGFSQIFMDAGLSSAIIYKQDISLNKLSSLYWLNISFGLILFVLILLISPLFASFYNEPRLTQIIMVLSCTFIINSIGNQYQILFQKKLKFKTLSTIEVAGSSLAFITAIYGAISGLGVYALVLHFLVKIFVNNFFSLVIGLKMHKPKFHFKKTDVDEFISFGLYQVGNRIVNYLNTQFDIIIIGRLLGTELLGVYSIAKQIVMRPQQIINPVVTKVSFPIMAKVQNNDISLNRIYIKTINYLCTINFPVYLTISIFAESIILLAFGKNWAASIDVLSILSIYYMFRSAGNPAGSLLLSKGRADLSFNWNFMVFLVMPLSIFIGSWWGLIGVALSLTTLSIVFIIPHWYFALKRVSNLNFFTYTKTILLVLSLSSLTAYSISFICNYFIDSQLTRFICYLILSVPIYYLLNMRFNKEFALLMVDLKIDKFISKLLLRIR